MQLLPLRLLLTQREDFNCAGLRFLINKPSPADEFKCVMYLTWEGTLAVQLLPLADKGRRNYCNQTLQTVRQVKARKARRWSSDWADTAGNCWRIMFRIQDKPGLEALIEQCLEIDIPYSRYFDIPSPISCAYIQSVFSRTMRNVHVQSHCSRHLECLKSVSANSS
jgi:hypothetical protein